DKSNEITAIPELLALLSIHGCIVSVDAVCFQEHITQTIQDGKADYVLRVKDNQPNLVHDIQE
ncbi:MAG: ISAs1 family transposase, partial [Planctomycetaceae bacterium]